jgi:hypothetical protein
MPVTLKIKNVIYERNIVISNNDARIPKNAAQKNWNPSTLNKYNLCIC